MSGLFICISGGHSPDTKKGSGMPEPFLVMMSEGELGREGRRVSRSGQEQH